MEGRCGGRERVVEAGKGLCRQGKGRYVHEKEGVGWVGWVGWMGLIGWVESTGR